MARPEHFRYECCQQMLVALAQEEELVLEVRTTPVRKRGFAHVLLVALMTTDGAVRATCRHEVDQTNTIHHLDYLTGVFGLVLYH